jgi:hypothetical protein
MRELHAAIRSVLPGLTRSGVTRLLTRLIACLLDALDEASSGIAGFALLAGTRAFTFIALLAWREPVLGGVGLVLLGLIGWLRWCWRNRLPCQRGRA